MAAEPTPAAKKLLNFNIGVLGHVDSGKTSLAKALSTTASTAAFDKNPQSKERGITLDLGFSSFIVDLPDHLKDISYEKLQFTLVDCPGHASLIRTIIGGAQIIDLMMLVIDITKGMQTQTAECLVIGEITCKKMVVVLNKVDLLPDAKKAATIEKMKKRMLKTLQNTRFANCPILAVASKPGGPEAPESMQAEGVSELIAELRKQSYLPDRDPSGPLLFSVDHCFSIRGQGTVMTGTMLSGKVAINDTVEIPALKMTRKVKSMQMFRQPVTQAIQGDRSGVCVTQFDPKQLERGLVCTPDTLPTLFAGIASVKKIPYFKGTCATKAKFHVTMGHDTVMAKVLFFGATAEISPNDSGDNSKFSFDQEYTYQEELLSQSVTATTTDDQSGASLVQTAASQQWALIEFEKAVICQRNCLVIGSKLDTDIHSNTCRLAFSGQLLHAITDKSYSETLLPNLKIFKTKSKEGVVERATDNYSVIGRSLFKKETNIQTFVGLKVRLSSGEEGVIEGGFGQSGKFKIRIPAGLKEETFKQLSEKGKKGKKAAIPQESEGATADGTSGGHQAIRIYLDFKRYIFDSKKQIIQT